MEISPNVCKYKNTEKQDIQNMYLFVYQYIPLFYVFFFLTIIKAMLLDNVVSSEKLFKKKKN